MPIDYNYIASKWVGTNMVQIIVDCAGKIVCTVENSSGEIVFDFKDLEDIMDALLNLENHYHKLKERE